MHVIACFCTYIRRPNLEHNTQNRNLSRKKQRKSGLKPENHKSNNNGAVVTETEHPKSRAQQKKLIKVAGSLFSLSFKERWVMIGPPKKNHQNCT